MDFQVRISEAALKDLEEILEYSWSNFPAAAEQFGAALLDHISLLGRFPWIGVTVANRRNVRLLVHTPILVYYRVEERRKRIVILHFRHGARQPLGLV